MDKQKKKVFVEKLESSGYTETRLAQFRAAQCSRGTPDTDTQSQLSNIVDSTGDTRIRKLLGIQKMQKKM